MVYKIDRLSRSRMDFAKLVEVMDAHGVIFVSVTQSFDTTTSMGRLTRNILLSLAQLEREVIGEPIRDKFAASRARGMWMGGKVPLGCDAVARTLVVTGEEAPRVRRTCPRSRSRMRSIGSTRCGSNCSRWQAQIVRSLVELVTVGPVGADIRLRVEGLAGLLRDLNAVAPDALRTAA